MPESGGRRLFFAVWPPPAVRAGLDDAIDALRSSSPSWLRWQPAERWHVTVLFLGNRSTEDCAGAAATGRDFAAATTPAALTVTGFGRFGSVLWAGLTGADWLEPLHRNLARRLQPREDRERFRAHLTLARARRQRIKRDLLDQLGAYEGPAWTPQELTLVASVTGPKPRYDVVAAFPFARPGG